MVVSSGLIGRVAFGFTLALLGSAAFAADTPIATKPIDPQRYLGRWYEVARIPNAFEKNCEGATSDWSKQGADQYLVVQTCHADTPSGPAKVWRGAGKVLDQASAKIRIAFFGGFINQDYIVVDRGDDYSWSILSTTNLKYVWIMSRIPVISASQKSTLVARARALGLDVSGLVYDIQAPS